MRVCDWVMETDSMWAKSPCVISLALGARRRFAVSLLVAISTHAILTTNSPLRQHSRRS